MWPLQKKWENFVITKTSKMATAFWQATISAVPFDSYPSLGHLSRAPTTSFHLVLTWLTERTYVRTYVRVYRLYGWVREDYQKEGRGVSGVYCQVHIFNIGHSQYGQLTAVKTGQPLTSILWPYRGLICQLIKVTWFIWKLSADQLIVLLDREQCSISYFY